MSDKVFLRADDVVRDAFALAHRIYRSGFIPDLLLAVWRGGTPVGIVIHEYLLYKGIETDHTVVKSVSYSGIGERGEPRLEGLDPVLERLTPASKVLVIDDIFDSGCTMQAVSTRLKTRTPHVRIATLYHKPACNRTAIQPDYAQRVTDRWIVFPHELDGLTADEIKAKDSTIYDLLQEG